MEQTTEPTLKKKMITGANYGMLAGFWTELPLLTVFAFKGKQHYWENLREWSLPVLPTPEPETTDTAKSWVKIEVEKEREPTEISR